MTTTNKGIDYGLGRTNRSASGIRYGVISQNDVGQAWYDSAEADYGEPTCPKCGNEATTREGFDYSAECGVFQCEDCSKVWYPMELGEEQSCPECQGHCAKTEFKQGRGCSDHACHHYHYVFDADEAFGDEPSGGYVYEADGYSAHCGQDGDIFILKSPYFTYAQFCSPCAPGACYLTHPLDEPDDNNKAFCFGHDWFEDGVAPYPVYSVETGELIAPTTS